MVVRINGVRGRFGYPKRTMRTLNYLVRVNSYGHATAMMLVANSSDATLPMSERQISKTLKAKIERCARKAAKAGLDVVQWGAT